MATVPLRICMVSDFFFPNMGGVENHIYQLSQCLVQRGHSITVITHAYSGRQGIRYLTNGIKVYYIPFLVVASQSTLPTVFGSTRFFRSILTRERIDIVHCHGAFSTLALESMVHTSILGIRCIFTDHSLFGFSDLGAIVTNALLKFVQHTADHCICVSNIGKQNTALRAAIPLENISVIPNAVETVLFTPSKTRRTSEKITIIILCRLMYRKGIDFLVDVIPQICEFYPEVSFLIGGEGPKRIILEEVREKRQLHERVTLKGSIRHEDVRDFLIQGDIFLNTSLTEAFCMAIVEAASCGLQVVSTNVGGIPEVLPDDMIFLCEPTAEALVNGLSKAIACHKLNRRVDPWEANERISKLYQWPNVSRRTEEIYIRVMAKPKITVAKIICNLFENISLFESLFWSYFLSILYLVYKVFDCFYPPNVSQFPILPKMSGDTVKLAAKLKPTYKH